MDPAEANATSVLPGQDLSEHTRLAGHDVVCGLKQKKEATSRSNKFKIIIADVTFIWRGSVQVQRDLAREHLVTGGSLLKITNPKLAAP